MDAEPLFGSGLFITTALVMMTMLQAFKQAAAVLVQMPRQVESSSRSVDADTTVTLLVDCH